MFRKRAFLRESEYNDVICSEGGLFSANLNDLALFVQIESVASEGYGWYSCWGGVNLMPKVEG